MLGGGPVWLGEDRHLCRAVHVFQGDEGHAVAALGGRLLDRRDLTEEEYAASRAARGQVARARDAEGFHHRPVASQRMAGHVKAEHFPLEGEPLIGVPFRDHGHWLRLRGGRRSWQEVKEGSLPFGPLALLTLP